MDKLKIKTDPAFDLVFDNYPDPAREKLLRLRKLILETANDTEGITSIEETLKWGEPSFLVKKGSTIRIDWKEKSPDQYAVYFKCTSKLVSTYRSVFEDTFKFEGNRAITFNMDDNIPEDELRSCIGAALQYHNVKHLSDLGI